MENYFQNIGQNWLILLYTNRSSLKRQANYLTIVIFELLLLLPYQKWLFNSNLLFWILSPQQREKHLFQAIFDSNLIYLRIEKDESEERSFVDLRIWLVVLKHHMTYFADDEAEFMLAPTSKYNCTHYLTCLEQLLQ